MTKRKMFLRMITASLIRRRSRMLVALLAIAVGATILSGLVTIYYDVPRQMGAQFRNYGANMILLPENAEDPLNEEDLDRALAQIPAGSLVGAAPYRYETVTVSKPNSRSTAYLDTAQQPVVAACTDIEGAKKTSPYWYIEGEWPSGDGELIVGKEIAELLSLEPGGELNVNHGHMMTVSGVLETGGSEEEYLYMSLSDMEALTGEAGSYDVVELSITGSQADLQTYADSINESVVGAAARLVKRVTQSEATVLTKLQSLVLLVTAVVLALTMICVATTMTAVVTERRKEIGLHKALGASNNMVIWMFMGEGLLLGLVGGLIGAGLGFAFAQAVSVNVFSSSIAFRPLLLPITILVSILVTGLACILPVRSATEIDPALVLKGE